MPVYTSRHTWAHQPGSQRRKANTEVSSLYFVSVLHLPSRLLALFSISKGIQRFLSLADSQSRIPCTHDMVTLQRRVRCGKKKNMWCHSTEIRIQDLTVRRFRGYQLSHGGDALAKKGRNFHVSQSWGNRAHRRALCGEQNRKKGGKCEIVMAI